MDVQYAQMVRQEDIAQSKYLMNVMPLTPERPTMLVPTH